MDSRAGVDGDEQQLNSQIGPPTPPRATVQRIHIFKTRLYLKYVQGTVHGLNPTARGRMDERREQGAAKRRGDQKVFPGSVRSEF